MPHPLGFTTVHGPAQRPERARARSMLLNVDRTPSGNIRLSLADEGGVLWIHIDPGQAADLAQRLTEITGGAS